MRTCVQGTCVGQTCKHIVTHMHANMWTHMQQRTGNIPVCCPRTYTRKRTDTYTCMHTPHVQITQITHTTSTARTDKDDILIHYPKTDTPCTHQTSNNTHITHTASTTRADKDNPHVNSLANNRHIRTHRSSGLHTKHIQHQPPEWTEARAMLIQRQKTEQQSNPPHQDCQTTNNKTSAGTSSCQLAIRHANAQG
jgi:hypothetical protein